MYKIYLFCLFLTLVLTSSCGIFKKSSSTFTNQEVATVIKTARSYIGTPYKYGGMNEDGIDCSGLVFLAFQSARLKLPRVSTDMAEVGQKVKVQEIRAGDLVFFMTNNSPHINHVGIVTERKSATNIIFIHSPNSGVREDNLFSKYYQNAFAKAMRPF